MVVIQAFLLVQFSSAKHIHADKHEHAHAQEHDHEPEHEQASCAYCLVTTDEDDDNVEIDLDGSNPIAVTNDFSADSFSQTNVYASQASSTQSLKLFARSVRAPPLT